jgi:uncharacterized protein (DUF1810 family)
VLHSKKTAAGILGQIDAKKLKSSITLFLEVDPNSLKLSKTLDQLYFGERDLQTLDLLKSP